MRLGITRLVSLAILTFCAMSVYAEDAKPSFNCAKASTKIEKMICADSNLAELDYQLAGRYQEFLSSLNEEKKIIARVLQRQWLRNRNDQCSSGSDSSIKTCLRNAYKDWLKWSGDGFLKAQMPLNDGQNHIDLLDSNTAYSRSLSYISGSEKNGGHGRYAIELDVSHNGTVERVFTGYEDYPYEQKYYYYADDIDSVWYLLSEYGDLSQAFHHKILELGPQCVSQSTYSLIFSDTDQSYKPFGEIIYKDGNSMCHPYSFSYSRARALPGKVVFDFTKTFDYYSYKPRHFSFWDSRYYTIDLLKRTTYWRTFFTDSTTDYFGENYSDLFERIGLNILEQIPYTSTDNESCQVPDYSIFYLRVLREEIGGFDVPMSLGQLQYIANNVLSSEHLSEAKDFKPLIGVVLSYLDEARKVDDWSNKLKESWRRYSDYRTYSPTDNPFINQGFTGNSCFVNMPSPVRGVSADEWLYGFWARRVSDGNVDQTEQILRTVYKLF